MSNLLAVQAAHSSHDDDSGYSSSEDGMDRSSSPAPTVVPRTKLEEPDPLNASAPPKFVDEPLLHKSEKLASVNASNLLAVASTSESPGIPDSQAPVMPSVDDAHKESTLESSASQEKAHDHNSPHVRTVSPQPLCFGWACATHARKPSDL